ncbi:hypothetical protein GJ496_010680 [Pomphorhynchus laevis]|nr:hypothetical protein GJ496_010680 [Pomphorhynchus laevis]
MSTTSGSKICNDDHAFTDHKIATDCAIINVAETINHDDVNKHTLSLNELKHENNFNINLDIMPLMNSKSTLPHADNVSSTSGFSVPQGDKEKLASSMLTNVSTTKYKSEMKSNNVFERCDVLQTNLIEKCNKKNLDDDFWNSRNELMDLYYNIIINNMQLAIDKRLMQKMWRFCVKIVIEYYQTVLCLSKVDFKKPNERKKLLAKDDDSASATVIIDKDIRTTSGVGTIVSDKTSANALEHAELRKDSDKSFTRDTNRDRHLSSGETNGGSRRKVEYRQFLEECRGFYLNLLMMIKCKQVAFCANCGGNDENNQIKGSLILDSSASNPMIRLCSNEVSTTVQSDSKYADIYKQNNITLPSKNNNSRLQRAVYAIIHSILVNIGDIARYMHQLSDARRCYLQATQVIPSLGQPYNQLAILYEQLRNQSSLYASGGFSNKGDFSTQLKLNDQHFKHIFEGERVLNLVFYYVRALSVPVSFPLALQNLKRFTKSLTISEGSCSDKGCEKLNKLVTGSKILARNTVCETPDDLITLFIHIFANIYNTIEFAYSSPAKSHNHFSLPNNNNNKRDSELDTPIECTLASAIQKLKASFVPVLTKHTISSQILIQMSTICIFLLDQTHHSNNLCSRRDSNYKPYNLINVNENDDSCDGKDHADVNHRSKMLPFATALISSFLDQLVEVAAMPINSELTLNRHDVLPAAYILLLYLLYTDSEQSRQADELLIKSGDFLRNIRQHRLVVEMNTVFWLNIGRLLSSFNVTVGELSSGSFFHKHIHYLLGEERFLQSFIPLDLALEKAKKVIRQISHDELNNLMNDDKCTDNISCSSLNVCLCEKDERQLRKIRMVKLLESYLIKRKESYKNLSPMETAIRLRNAIPLKILHSPASTSCFTRFNYNNEDFINDKQNKRGNNYICSARQISFQSDLDLLQKMQCVDDINISTALNVQHKSDSRVLKTSNSISTFQNTEQHKQNYFPRNSNQPGGVQMLNNQILSSSIYRNKSPASYHLADASCTYNNSINSTNINGLHSNRCWIPFQQNPVSSMQSTYRTPYYANNAVTNSSLEDNYASAFKPNFIQPHQVRIGSNTAPTTQMRSPLVNYLSPNNIAIAPDRISRIPVLPDALIQKFNSISLNLIANQSDVTTGNGNYIFSSQQLQPFTKCIQSQLYQPLNSLEANSSSLTYLNCQQPLLHQQQNSALFQNSPLNYINKGCAITSTSNIREDAVLNPKQTAMIMNSSRKLCNDRQHFTVNDASALAKEVTSFEHQKYMETNCYSTETQLWQPTNFTVSSGHCLDVSNNKDMLLICEIELQNLKTSFMLANNDISDDHKQRSQTFSLWCMRVTCKVGHFSKVCRSKPKQKSRINMIDTNHKDSRLTTVLLKSISKHGLHIAEQTITVNDSDVVALFDTGSSEHFIDFKLVNRIKLNITPCRETVSMATKAGPVTHSNLQKEKCDEITPIFSNLTSFSYQKSLDAKRNNSHLVSVLSAEAASSDYYNVEIHHTVSFALEYQRFRDCSSDPYNSNTAV